MDLLVPFIIIFALVLLNALFVAAEFAIIGVRPSRVEQLAQEGNRTAIGIREIVHTPSKVDRYIATAQLGITLASLGLGMYGEPVIAHLIEAPLHDWFGLEGEIVHTVSFFVALTLITYLHVVIGEMMPKSLALQNAERTVLLLAVPMAFMQAVFSFAVTWLNKIGVLVLKLLRVPPPKHGSRLYTSDDLELIVADSVVGGLLEEQEQQLVENIFDFAERRVGQVMTPRMRIQAFPITINESELLEQVFDSPHTRFPVYKDNFDNILGILHLKDLVRQQISDEPFNLRKLLRDAPRFPETLYAETALAQLRHLHVHMATVIDEYHGTAGIVTLEDLIEEVVGEVRDEFDTAEEEPIIVVEPGHLTARGDVSLDELTEYVEIGEHEYDVESIGGLVLAKLNRPPAVDDEVTVNSVIFRVKEVDGLSIERLSIHFTPPEEHTDSVH